MSKKRKRKRVARDKQTDLPKKYLSGLKGSKRSERASLIKAMSEAYKKGDIYNPYRGCKPLKLIERLEVVT